MTRSLLILSMLVSTTLACAQTATVAGTYRGKLPCADCSGIEETLILKCKAPCRSGSYKRRDKYLNTANGNMSRDEAGKWKLIRNTSGKDPDTLQLYYDKTTYASWYIFSDKNTLQLLDSEKQPIDAPFDMSLHKKK